MKRTLAIVVGLATVGTAVYVGSRLWAQTPGGTAPPAAAPVAAPPRTPARIINVSRVVKHYNRWLNFQEEYKALYKTMYQEKIESKKKILDAHTVKIQDPRTSPAEKEMLEKEARKLQREMQEVSDDAKQTLGKREADMIVIIYKEIETAVREYCSAGAVELVLQYSDATEEPDLHAAANVGRKISNGACFPIYAAPRMDISDDILRILNSRVQPVAPARTSTGPGPSIPAPGTIQPIGGTQPPTRP